MARNTRKVAPTLDLPRIAKVGEQLRQLRDQLSLIFPERLHLIEQILYALLTREHVLVFGIFGTGKSDLLHTLFESIEGGVVFPIGLSKFMTEANLIGIPDPKVMREDGEIKYRRDGGILDAHFAELDELFDSNPPLLRVLLGILNERQFKRGRQIEDAKLMTAVACTNGDPEEEKRKSPELGAVIDRFLFMTKVSYLQSKDSRMRMFEKYLTGECPKVRIKLEDLEYASSVVVDANQITDMSVVEAYDDIIEAYSKQTKIIISDRRKCKLLQLVEANALLFGRFDVDYEDLMAVRWGLCQGNNDGQHDIFKAVARPIIDVAIQNRQQPVDKVEVALLQKLQGSIPKIPTKDQQTPDALVDLSRQLIQLRQEVTGVHTHLPSTEELQKKITAVIDDRKQKIQNIIDKG